MDNKLRKFTKENLDKRIKRKNKVGTVKSVLTYLLIAIITIWVIIFVLGKVSEGNNKFQINSFVVISGSMNPTLKVNDLIFSKKIEESEIQKGDIISFIKDNQVITHRINNILEKDGKRQYETKGDNNNDIDEENVTYEEIVGKYIFRIPVIGYLVRSSQTQMGLVVIIIIFIGLEMYARDKNDKEIMRHEKRMKKEEQEKSEK